MDSMKMNYARYPPTVLTACSIEHQGEYISEDDNMKKNKMEKEKEKILMCLVVFNGFVLLLLIALFLVPVYESRNCV